MTSLVVGSDMCTIWQPRSLKPLDSRRATIAKVLGSTVEGYHQLMGEEKAVAAEGEAVVGVVRVDAEAEASPMERSSMKWTVNTSNNASTQSRRNIWVLKETPISPRRAQRKLRKDILTSTSPGGM